MIRSVSSRFFPVPAFVDFFTESVITALYLPAGTGSKSVVGFTFHVLKPCRLAIINFA